MENKAPGFWLITAWVEKNQVEISFLNLTLNQGCI